MQMGTRPDASAKSLMKLSWPIFIELILQLLVGNMDQIQLSHFNETAVAAVGNANTIITVVLLTFNVISLAAMILVSQYRGANDLASTNQIYTLSLLVNGLLSLFLAVVLLVFAEGLFSLMQVPQELMAEACTYLRITAAALPFQAIMLTFSAFLRAGAHMKVIMLITGFINVCNIIGNAVAFLGVYVHLKRKMGIRFCAVGPRAVGGVLRRSLPFFSSRIATTVYTATNTVVLNIISGTGAVTGYYTSADKLITTAKSGMSPISDSMYPYMVKNRDFRLVKKTLKLLMPLILVGCIVVGIFAEPLCVLFFGAEYAESAQVLRVMLPVVVVILPSYILGFPTLSPMGLAKHANYSTIVGSVFYVGAMVALFATGHVTMVTLGLLTSATEILIFLYRFIVVWHYRDRMNPKWAGEEA